MLARRCSVYFCCFAWIFLEIRDQLLEHFSLGVYFLISEKNIGELSGKCRPIMCVFCVSGMTHTLTSGPLSSVYFWWNFCLLYYSLRRLECSSVSRDVRPTNGRWGLSWWERRDPSWSVSAWPATNISNNNNNAQSDQPDTILFHYTITRLLLSPAQ